MAFVDISAGIFEAPGAVMDPMYYPQGWNTYAAEEVKKHVKIPVITSHTLRDPDYCERILAEGKADLVGLSRQMIADPYWAQQGLPGPRRRDPQVHLLPGGLLAGVADDQPAHAVRDQPGHRRRAVPAPAAGRRIAPRGGGRRRPGRHGSRPHRRAPRPPGDDLREAPASWAARSSAAAPSPGKHKMRWYADWLRQQIKKLGVEVRYRTSPGVDELRAFDAVILATGGGVARPDVPGIDPPLVVTLRRRAALPHGGLRVLRPRETAGRRLRAGPCWSGATTSAPPTRPRSWPPTASKVYVVTERPAVRRVDGALPPRRDAEALRRRQRRGTQGQAVPSSRHRDRQLDRHADRPRRRSDADGPPRSAVDAPGRQRRPGRGRAGRRRLRSSCRRGRARPSRSATPSGSATSARP